MDGSVVRVGVLGCGNVGAALVQLIEARRDEIEARVTHLVYLPYDTDTVQITQEMWLELDEPAGTTRRLNIIHAINVGEMNREIELQCEEQK